jgi:predicted amidohydrolase
MRITVGLAQIYPRLGDVRANLDKHLAFVEQADQQGVDLLVFPELSLTGYQVQDLVPEVAIRATRDDATFRALLDASAHMDISFGFVHADKRQRFYIAQAYLSQGECLHIHHKIYLPTYGMFDDGRYFDQGTEIRAFDTRYGRFGMLICEDFWHMSAPYVLWMDGADVMIFGNSSPSRGVSASEGGRLTVARWVELMTQAYGSTFTDYVIMCNRVGYEDGKNFWGGSLIVNPEGEFLTHGLYFDETLITQMIDLNQLHRTRSRMPLLRDERPQLIQRELARILREDGEYRE